MLQLSSKWHLYFCSFRWISSDRCCWAHRSCWRLVVSFGLSGLIPRPVHLWSFELPPWVISADSSLFPSPAHTWFYRRSSARRQAWLALPLASKTSWCPFRPRYCHSCACQQSSSWVLLITLIVPGCCSNCQALSSSNYSSILLSVAFHVLTFWRPESHYLEIWDVLSIFLWFLSSSEAVQTFWHFSATLAEKSRALPSFGALYCASHFACHCACLSYSRSLELVVRRSSPKIYSISHWSWAAPFLTRLLFLDSFRSAIFVTSYALVSWSVSLPGSSAWKLTFSYSSPKWSQFKEKKQFLWKLFALSSRATASDR